MLFYSFFAKIHKIPVMEHIDLLNNDLQVSPVSQNFLNEAARWGKFLSIAGFIFCGVIVISAFFVPSIYSHVSQINSLPPEVIQSAATTLSIVYFIVAVILFFPCLFLYRFSVKMKVALTSMSQENFENSFQNLKSLFKFYGIVTIILLSFYALIFVIFMLAIAMNS